jgi:hypothetical protein
MEAAGEFDTAVAYDGICHGNPEPGKFIKADLFDAGKGGYKKSMGFPLHMPLNAFFNISGGSCHNHTLWMRLVVPGLMPVIRIVLATCYWSVITFFFMI